MLIDRESTITEEKQEAIRIHKECFEKLKINPAKKIALYSRYLKVDDPFFATIENITKLNALCLGEIENAKAKESKNSTKKKDSKEEKK